MAVVPCTISSEMIVIDEVKGNENDKGGCRHNSRWR